MKEMEKTIFILLITMIFGCGTQESLTDVTYVKYGIVQVSQDLTVAGILVYENDSFIELSIDGAIKSYTRSEILNFKTELRPDKNAMLKDVVKNTRATASNTGFFVALTIIITVVAVIATVAQ